MRYHVSLASDDGEVTYQNETVTFVADRDSENASCSLTLTLSDREEDTYLFVPAAVYNGNKMRRVKRSYPPMYEAEECGVKPEPLITNLPARTLPSGWICERVNTSDWERPWRVGGVFYGSCWCETSVLLSFCELMDKEEIASALQELRGDLIF